MLLGLGGAALVGGLPEAAVSADLFGSLAGGAASLSSVARWAAQLSPTQALPPLPPSLRLPRVSSASPTPTPKQALLLTLSALVPGAFATILQAEGQKVVPAASAQPIFASMPLFAAGWACLLLHEPISAQQAIGGAGTCAAALLAAAAPGGSRPGGRAAAAAAVPEEAADGAARGVVVPTRAAALAAARGEPVPGEAREKVASARMRRR